jgi:hypothetical protein
VVGDLLLQRQLANRNAVFRLANASEQFCAGCLIFSRCQVTMYEASHCKDIESRLIILKLTVWS